ncbi:MAG: hypothetical protein NZ839_03105, partial [Endomicrobia bacterium]|nr:hypothetical protein [Endomicrobiia bacterium]
MNFVNSTDTICPHFGVCGGCENQNLDYSQQIEIKQKYIQELFKSFDILELTPMLPSPKIWYYRNKMEFIIGKQKTGEIVAGLRQKGKFYKIVNLNTCKISFLHTGEILDIVRNWVKETRLPPYDLFTHTGKVRYLVVRHSKSEDKLMLNLVVTGTKYQIEHNEKVLYQDFIYRANTLKNVSSIYLSINNKVSDNAVPEEILHIYGEEYLVETVNGVKYLIYPNTFFQPNTECCNVLYKTVLNEIVEGNTLDLYCGSGGITLQIAKNNFS